MKRVWWIGGLFLACSASGGSGGGGGNPNGAWCGAPAFPDPRGDAVNNCISTACCAQINACAGDTTCLMCRNNGMAPGCATSTTFQNFLACGRAVAESCVSGGGGGSGGTCGGVNTPCVASEACCSGLTCCERTSPPTCQSIIACRF